MINKQPPPGANERRLQVKPIANDLPLADRLALTTTRIECWTENGDASVGTGFLFRFFTAGNAESIPAIVTNKHVIRGARSAQFWIHGSDGKGTASPAHGIWVAIQEFEKLCIPHPDPEVDLCVFPYASIVRGALEADLSPVLAELAPGSILDDDSAAKLSSVEDVLMVGYPNGIRDDHNALPIMRRGSTATHCAKDFGGKREFLIDVCTIPGSSGSPVFLYRTGDTEQTIRLLGVVYAMLVQTVEGELKAVPIPSSKMSVTTQIPINLGVVLHAARILEFSEELERRSKG
jgi:hypothetical protein